MLYFVLDGGSCKVSKDSEFYGSNAGADMTATYHSVIETVKVHGSSIWNFIETFFKNIFNITLATS